MIIKHWLGIALLLLAITSLFFKHSLSLENNNIIIALAFISIVSFAGVLTHDTKIHQRVFALISGFAFSLLIAIILITYNSMLINELTKDNSYNDIIFRAFLYSIPPLPIFFILWIFRHTDTQENLHQNALFDAQNKMLEPTAPHKAVAMQQLKVLLEQVPRYEEQILLTIEEGMHRSAWEDEPNKTKTFNLHNFYLNERNFSNAILNYEDLQEKHLINTNLEKAELIKSNLRHAILFGADLRNANLDGANLTNADLRGVKLQGANFISAILSKAIFDDDTIFADDTNYKQQAITEHGMIHEDDLSTEELERLNEPIESLYPS